MSRVTLQLPETLHRHLASQAQQEGVSLQQYLLYALTRQLAQSSTVQVVSEEAVAQQQDQFRALLDTLGHVDATTVTAAFAARDTRVPEPELTPEILTRFHTRLTQRASADTASSS